VLHGTGGRYLVTAICSVFAYVWLLIILAGISPDIIQPWEAVVTLLFFPILVGVCYMLDARKCCFQTGKGQEAGDPLDLKQREQERVIMIDRIENTDGTTENVGFRQRANDDKVNRDIHHQLVRVRQGLQTTTSDDLEERPLTDDEKEELKKLLIEKQADLARKGDPRGIRFDDKGRCEDFSAQLVVPSVNSFSLAASFLLTLLILWIEVFNLVEDVEGERDRHLCYVLLGVQFCLSGLAQVLATSAMDRRDETYIYALQSAGSVSAGGPFVGRLESIRVASTVDAVDLEGSCGRKGTCQGAVVPCPVVFCGGSLNFVIAYRGRSGYAGQDLGRVNPADPVVAFVATLVILLCNVLW